MKWNDVVDLVINGHEHREVERRRRGGCRVGHGDGGLCFVLLLYPFSRGEGAAQRRMRVPTLEPKHPHPAFGHPLPKGEGKTQRSSLSPTPADF